jgi:2-polyprenyl-6-methoxyphenol hydroxylase-like FAD-dependent oxidoreductase
VTEHARLVIGADGRHSMVAKAVQAPEYGAVPSLTCAYYSYWSGVDCDRAQLYSRPGRAIAAMPTNDGLTCVYVAARRADVHAFRADPEGEVNATLRLAGDLGGRVGDGQRVERFRGTDDLPNFLRRPYGEGWALVGDAGCHKDPVPAQGISDAFRDAELLSDAVVSGLSSGRMTGALSEYERVRDEFEVPRYRFALQLASLEPPEPEFAQLLTALAADPNQTSQFLGLLAGTTAFEDVFGTMQAQR